MVLRNSKISNFYYSGNLIEKVFKEVTNSEITNFHCLKSDKLTEELIGESHPESVLSSTTTPSLYKTNFWCNLILLATTLLKCLVQSKHFFFLFLP